MKYNSYLGVVFAIPTTKQEYLTGIVVREKKNVLLCYFFGTIYNTIPESDKINIIINDKLLYVKQVSNMGLKDGSWEGIGRININKEEWVIPCFFKQDILTKKFYFVELDENLNEIVKEQITEEESKGMYADGLAGSVFMERFLSKLLY